MGMRSGGGFDPNTLRNRKSVIFGKFLAQFFDPDADPIAVSFFKTGQRSQDV